MEKPLLYYLNRTPTFRISASEVTILGARLKGKQNQDLYKIDHWASSLNCVKRFQRKKNNRNLDVFFDMEKPFLYYLNRNPTFRISASEVTILGTRLKGEQNQDL